MAPKGDEKNGMSYRRNPVIVYVRYVTHVKNGVSPKGKRFAYNKSPVSRCVNGVGYVREQRAFRRRKCFLAILWPKWPGEYFASISNREPPPLRTGRNSTQSWKTSSPRRTGCYEKRTRKPPRNLYRYIKRPYY